MNPNQGKQATTLSGGEQSKEKYFLQSTALCTTHKHKGKVKIGFQVEVQHQIPTNIAIDSGA